MDIKTIQRTCIYGELDADEAKERFAFKRDAYITHVDTFYYSVHTLGCWNDDKAAKRMFGELWTLRLMADDKGESVSLPGEAEGFDDKLSGLSIRPHMGFINYRLCIGKQDCFDIFMAERVMDGKMPGIFVQVRSQYLWLKGTEPAVRESLGFVYALLEQYGVEVADITENRIDFAWHTNAIQDMMRFFPEKHLGEMKISALKRGGDGKEYEDLERIASEVELRGDEVEKDYLTFGRRKSNSVFVRVYNKTKEVVQMGYKQFFVLIWFQKGLISAFDKWVLEKIFEDGKQSWDYRHVARCKYYLEYGKDEAVKEKIRKLLAGSTAILRDFRALADGLVPDVTLVVNFEIEVKRKFTATFPFREDGKAEAEYPEGLPVREQRLYSVFKYMGGLRAFLTQNTIRFVKYKGEYRKLRRERRPTAEWWKRLSACKEEDEYCLLVMREYQHNYDVQLTRARAVTSLASLSALLKFELRNDDEDFSVSEAVLDALSTLNDNDIERFQRVRRRKQSEVSARYGTG